MDTLVTTKQLAAYLAKSESWVRTHARELGGTQIGKDWRFHPSLLDALTPKPVDPDTLRSVWQDASQPYPSPTANARGTGPSGGVKKAGSAKQAGTTQRRLRRQQPSRSESAFDKDFPEYAPPAA